MDNEYEAGEYVQICDGAYWVLQENGCWLITNGTPYWFLDELGRVRDMNNTKVAFSTTDEAKFNEEFNRVFSMEYYELMAYLSGGENINNYSNGKIS